MKVEHGKEGYRLDIGMRSFIGSRDEQQDAVFVEIADDATIFAVCDGMGGLNGGKQASETAIETLKILFAQRKRNHLGAEFYLHAVDVLDESICALQRAINGKSQTGTTIVSAMITESHLHWLSVGDSRLYLVRGNEMACVTTDHNYYYLINKALQAGKMTASEYQKESARGNALISFIGMGGVELVDINNTPFTLKRGDTIILASDGVHQTIEDSAVAIAFKTLCLLLFFNLLAQFPVNILPILEKLFTVIPEEFCKGTQQANTSPTSGAVSITSRAS